MYNYKNLEYKSIIIMSNYLPISRIEKFHSFEIDILRYLESNLILYIFGNLKYLALPCNKKKKKKISLL